MQLCLYYVHELFTLSTNPHRTYWALHLFIALVFARLLFVTGQIMTYVELNNLRISSSGSDCSVGFTLYSSCYWVKQVNHMCLC